MAELDERSEIAAQNIAEFLKDLMKKKGITPQGLIATGINKKQVYSVLRMGAVQRPDYQFSTFIKVLSAVGVHLELHDLSEKSNINLNPDFDSRSN